MKVFVCLLLSLSLFASIHAQDNGPTGTADTEVEAPTVVEPQEVKSCLTGSIVFDGETVTRNETLQDCPLGQDSCQTKVEVSPTGWRVYKECKAPEACENEQANNPQLCESEQAEEKGERLCHYCCDTDGCNTDDVIPIELSTAIPDSEE